MSATREMTSGDDYDPARDWRRVEPEPDIPAAAQIAEVILSGRTGRELYATLMQRFPAARRGDVYLAVGLVMAVTEADLTAAEIELQDLRCQAVAP
jgi:hypothetical protein